MKVLTICEDGINRSVAARWLLQHEGHEVIAIGYQRHSLATLEMLYDWADLIVVLDAELASFVPPIKLVVWHVGPAALYPHHLNTDLVRKLRGFWMRDFVKFDSGPRE